MCSKNIEMSLLFLLFLLELFPSFEFYLRERRPTLYFNGLGIFECISRACWSKSMCGHRTVDVLHRWIIELAWTDNMSTAITNKQRGEISHLQYTFVSRQVCRNRLLIHGELYQRTLKTELSEAKTFLTSFEEHLRAPLAVVRLSSLIICDQNTLVDLKRDTFEETIIVNRSTQQRYIRFYR